MLGTIINLAGLPDLQKEFHSHPFFQIVDESQLEKEEKKGKGLPWTPKKVQEIPEGEGVILV